MKPIKLTVKTNSENYPIIIGSNIIKNTSSFFKNSCKSKAKSKNCPTDGNWHDSFRQSS